MAAGRVTISDVARVAGVAQSTVSLVLNRRGRVSPVTRCRIQEVMDQLGYVPRRSSSRPQRHVAILYGRGMIFCRELVNYCREWIAGIREGLGDRGADVSVFCGRGHVSQDFMFEASLIEDGLDGLVVMGVHPHDGYLQRVLETGLPLVVMNNRAAKTEFSSVCLDYDAAGRLAADHLVGLGHRRIGLLLNRSEYPRSALSAGFLDRLRAHGLEPALHLQDPDLSFEDLAAFDRHARRFAAAGVTAILAGDPAGYRLANALEAMAVDVPEQMSLIAIDNLGLSTDTGRRLCSIDYDKRGMGRLAGRMLQDLLSAEGSVSNLIAHVPPRLFQAQTTAPCPATSGRVGPWSKRSERSGSSNSRLLSLNG